MDLLLRLKRHPAFGKQRPLLIVQSKVKAVWGLRCLLATGMGLANLFIHS